MPQSKVIALSENTEMKRASGTSGYSNMGVDDSEIDLMALIGALWRGKWIIALMVVIAVGIGGYYAYRVAVPVYTTTATVALDSQQQNVTDLTSVVSGLSGDQATINTEVEVMRSRGLINKLVLELDLINDPEFNSTLVPADPYAIKPFIKRMLGLSKEAKAPNEQKILNSTIDAVIDAVSVSNLRQSYVFSLKATTTSPEKSALIANTLADLYILDQLDVKFKATQQATKWLTDRVAELKLELERAANNVKEFNADAELVSPEGLVGLRRQLKEIRDRVNGGEQLLKDQATRIAALKVAMTADDPKIMADVANDRNLNRALTMLESGDLDRDTFNSSFATVLKRAEVENERSTAQISTLGASVAQLEMQIDRQSSDLLKLQQLEQEASASQTIYEYFLNRLKETSVQQGIQKADSRVLSQATVPNSASAPRKSMIVALSLMLGLFTGAGLVLFREMLQNGFRSGEEMEQNTGYTVMGQIPIMPVKRRMETIDYLIDKPASAAAEAVRNLRTSVLLSDVDNPPKVIMIASSMPGEGKTTESLALAHNLSGMGKKVLLVEGDIRRRTFSKYFDISEMRGILSVVSDGEKLKDVVHKDERMGVDVLIGEKTTTNAADIFSSDKFAAFIEKARADYDYVVIDTPPVLVVPDARVISKLVDAILFVVKWDATPKAQVLQSLKMFEQVGTQVSGLVLSQIDPVGMKKYGYIYGGHYATGYYDN